MTGEILFSGDMYLREEGFEQGMAGVFFSPRAFGDYSSPNDAVVTCGTCKKYCYYPRTLEPPTFPPFHLPAARESRLGDKIYDIAPDCFCTRPAALENLSLCMLKLENYITLDFWKGNFFQIAKMGGGIVLETRRLSVPRCRGFMLSHI